MRDASFHLLDRAAWPRSEHFDYYIRTVKCRYDLTAHLAVTALRERGKALGLRFYPLLLYITARAINANREFRMGFNEHGAPGYWDFINPSYTIFHDDDKTFSDVWSEYDESFPVFYQNVLHDMETYKDIKGVRAKPGRPANCCPMSALPWLSFTGMAHVQATEPPFLPPIITFQRGTIAAVGRKIGMSSTSVSHEIRRRECQKIMFASRKPMTSVVTTTRPMARESTGLRSRQSACLSACFASS